MEHNKLKQNVQAITMPDAMRTRITKNIRNEIYQEDQTMNRKCFKPAAIAAALALCLCLPLGAAATGFLGHFEDVKNWYGAVVGTKYENATEEIAVSAKITDNALTVTATLLFPKEAPYPYIEILSIGSYSITDARGAVLTEGSNTAAAALNSHQAEISLPLDISLPEGCTLKIRSFIADAKGEQPLPISGNWEIPIQY